jgi:hypothetical protein
VLGQDLENLEAGDGAGEALREAEERPRAEEAGEERRGDLVGGRVEGRGVEVDDRVAGSAADPRAAATDRRPPAGAGRHQLEELAQPWRDGAGVGELELDLDLRGGLGEERPEGGGRRLDPDRAGDLRRQRLDPRVEQQWRASNDANKDNGS